MIIDVRDILKAAGLAKTLEFEFPAESCGIADDECDFAEPVSVNAELTNVSGVIRARGTVRAAYTASCARCLKPVRRVIEKPFDEEYFKAGVMSAEQLEDADAYEYAGGEVDLGFALRDAVLLEIPIRHLCGEDCRSLCPVCGRDLNEGECDCDTRSVDPRLEALRGMLNGLSGAGFEDIDSREEVE